MQWDSVNWKDTSTRMVMPSSDGDVENGLTISAICIRNGQVDEFNYISEADLLGIIDMDDDAIPRYLFLLGKSGRFCRMTRLNVWTKCNLDVRKC